jgi:hypothetical protein
MNSATFQGQAPKNAIRVGASSAVRRTTSNTSSNNAILPRDWLVPGALNGGFTSRVPIQYYNVNIAVMAAKLDDWATMSYDVLDQQKTRALELSRQWSPEVLRTQYEAVLAGCRPGALAPRSLEVVSIYERGIRKLLHGDTALLSERTSDRHQSFLGECLKVCFALQISVAYTPPGMSVSTCAMRPAGGSPLTFKRLLTSSASSRDTPGNS